MMIITTTVVYATLLQVRIELSKAIAMNIYEFKQKQKIMPL